MENNYENKIHFAQIVGQEKVELNTVREVLSSTDKEVVVKLENSFLRVTGTELTILKLLPETGELCIKGKIEGLKYSAKSSKKSFFGKVFK